MDFSEKFSFDREEASEVEVCQQQFEPAFDGGKSSRLSTSRAFSQPRKGEWGEEKFLPKNS